MKILLSCSAAAVFAAGCSYRADDLRGAEVRGDQELCVRYATSRDESLRARIAAEHDAATMAAIDAGELNPGLPALVAYCVHGAPIGRTAAATPEGKVERVVFCAKPVGTGEACDTRGPEIVVAQDKIAANPQPSG